MDLYAEEIQGGNDYDSKGRCKIAKADLDPAKHLSIYTK